MKMTDLKQVQCILLSVFLLMVALALITVAAYETELLTPTDFANRQTAVFLWQTGLELFSIIAIPTALKLFKIPRIHRQLTAGKAQALLRWGLIRINLLCLPMLACTLLYYQTMSPTFGYLAIILLLCLFFVYPSKDRCVAETMDVDNNGSTIPDNEREDTEA